MLQCIYFVYIKIMKTKINKWGNSHGIRLSAPMLEHLNADNGSQVEVKLTKNGIELVKNTDTVDVFNQIKTQMLDGLIKQSYPVKTIADPNKEGDNDYIVISIDSSMPLIREVAKGFEGGFKTLADAKHEARKIINENIEQSKKSLSEIRQIGIDTIRYINL